MVESGRSQGRPGSFVFDETDQLRFAYNEVISHIMEQASDHIRVRIDQLERLLMFDYEPGTEAALFDICDGQGHIVKSGEIRGPETRVRITDLHGEEYYLMVLDGEVSTVKPFQLRRAG